MGTCTFLTDFLVSDVCSKAPVLLLITVVHVCLSVPISVNHQLPCVESDAPEALMAMPEQNTSAMSVTFREPIEPNGNIVRYELTYESLDTDFQIRPETLVVEDVDTTPIRTRVVGLRRLTAYRFTLRAVNSLGPGLPAVATATMAGRCLDKP